MNAADLLVSSVSTFLAACIGGGMMLRVALTRVPSPQPADHETRMTAAEWEALRDDLLGLPEGHSL